MATFRGILIFIHVLSLIFWLGPDIVVLYLSFAARDRSASPEIRLERLRIARIADTVVKYAWQTAFVTGAILFLGTGSTQAYLNNPWFVAKLGGAALVLLVIFTLRRTSVVGKLRAAIAAEAAGDDNIEELRAEVAKRTPRSRALVLSIWVLFITMLFLALKARKII